MNRLKAEDVALIISCYRYLIGLGAHPSHEEQIAAVSSVLRKMGIPHSPAQYDAAGNCLTCGEAGRCPGVHTFEEIQAANHLQKGNTP